MKILAFSRWIVAIFLIYFIYQGESLALLIFLIWTFIRFENTNRWAGKLSKKLNPSDKLGFTDKPIQQMPRVPGEYNRKL